MKIDLSLSRMDWHDFRLRKRLQWDAALTETVDAVIAEIDAVKRTCRLINRPHPQTIARLT